MARFATGIFTPKNPAKYVGKHLPRYRSSWELVFMTFLDQNSNIMQWASESIAIQYRHPLTGKIANYIPDFLVLYQNKSGRQLAEIVEVKPKSQTAITEAKSKHDKLHVVVNTAKWRAAAAYCKQHGMTFRIVTEMDIFHQPKGK
jgi:hypothetical protein